MVVTIDIRPALRKGTGVGTFVEQLVLALDAMPGDHELKLFSSSWKDRWPLERLGSLQRSDVFDRRWPVKFLNLFWHRWAWPPIDSFVGPTDVAHSPSPLLMPSKGARVITLHDLHFLRHPHHTHGEMRRDYPRLVRKHVARADAVLAVSAATARDAEELLGLPSDRVVVCSEDAAPLFNEPPSRDELAASEKAAPQPFLLFVGTIEPRKNLPTLLQAFALVKKRFPEIHLVVAGSKGWGWDDFAGEMRSLPDPGKVLVTGYLDPISLRALYHRAMALVMPSLCEGFGLPLVEAMACGCPLVVADNSALPEVAGEAALYWRSSDPEELAGLLIKVVEDTTVRQLLAKRGKDRRKHFSWEKTAGIVMSVYRDVVGTVS